MSISTFRIQAQNHKWFAFLVRSIMTLLFTLMLILCQQMGIQGLLYMLAIYILIDSGITIATSLLYRRGDWMIFGIIASMIGSYGLFPAITPAFFILALITAWTALRGIFELSAALKLHQSRRSPIWLALSALLSIVFSLFSIITTPDQILSTRWLLIIYLACIGTIWMFLAFAMRKQDQASTEAPMPHQPIPTSIVPLELKPARYINVTSIPQDSAQLILMKLPKPSPLKVNAMYDMDSVQQER